MNIEISPDSIQFLPGSLTVLMPSYADADRQKIKAVVQFADGQYREVEGRVSDTGNPFIRDVFAQYSSSEIEMFTHRASIVQQKREELVRQESEDRRIEEERRATFAAKERALNMAEIQGCGDEELLRKIRRAKNSFEVLAWASVALGAKK